MENNDKIEVNDVLFADNIYYKVTYVCEKSNTIDLKGFNLPVTIKAVPIDSIKEVEGAIILKELPKNVVFLRNRLFK